MNLLRIILISILMVLILFNAIGLQILSVISETFLQASFYEKIAIKQGFYAQLRQLIFRLINKSLPNGREGMPYFQEAVTESWLKEELSRLISQFLDFIKGWSEEPPIIPIYKMKERVIESIDGNKTLTEKERLVQYWFDPLPDKVRLQDFISPQAILGFKRIITGMRLLLVILLGSFLILSGLVYLLIRDWKSALLWISAATMASGIQTIAIGLGLDWIMKHSTYILKIYERIIAFEIPNESAWGLIKAIKNGFTDPLILVGAIVAIISGAVIYFIPIKERSLTLVK